MRLRNRFKKAPAQDAKICCENNVKLLGDFKDSKSSNFSVKASHENIHRVKEADVHLDDTYHVVESVSKNIRKMDPERELTRNIHYSMGTKRQNTLQQQQFELFDPRCDSS